MNNQYTIWKHKEFDDSLKKIIENTEHSAIRKLDWIMLQLAMNGYTSQTKPTYNHKYRWRRNPIKETYHYYIWWIPSSEIKKSDVEWFGNNSLLLRKVRHHDDNETHLEVGDVSEYDQVKLDWLDPRYIDQVEISKAVNASQSFSSNVVTGSPGSGKTISLLYAALDLAKRDNQKIIYVTYTEKLADYARTYLSMYSQFNKIYIYTFKDLCQMISGKSINEQPRYGDYNEIQLFKSLLNRLSKEQLGNWYRYPDLLWMEIRAYLYGMALPIEWKREGVGHVKPCAVLDLNSYIKIREGTLTQKDLTIAHSVALRYFTKFEKCNNYFEEIKWANTVLSAISQEATDKVLTDPTALIVDEIQDFTLLQIYMLFMLIKQSKTGSNEKCFILAGDESQTIYPSGFDWPKTKDLICNILPDIHPREFTLRSQRRCPSNLAKLITTSENLYKMLNCAALIPRYHKCADVESDDESLDSGNILRWKVCGPDAFEEILIATQEYPDLAVIDLQYESSNIKSKQKKFLKKLEKLNIYSAKQIKGLEKKVVIIYGIEKLMLEILELAIQDRNPVGKLRVRSLIDTIRVGISRATNTLIFVEESTDKYADQLYIKDIEIYDTMQIKDTLESIYRDMSNFEIVLRFVEDSKDSFKNKDYERAFEQIDRAEKLFMSIRGEDQQINTIITEQKEIVCEELALEFLNESKMMLDRNEIGKAKALSNRAYQKIQLLTHNTESFHDLYRENLKYIYCFSKFETLSSYLSNDLVKALNFYRNVILKIRDETDSEKIKNRIIEAKNRIVAKQNIITNEYWMLAEKSRTTGDWSKASLYYQACADYKAIIEDAHRKLILDRVADRYRNLPPCNGHEDNYGAMLMEYINKYCDDLMLMEDGNIKESVYVNVFLREWILEILSIINAAPADIQMIWKLIDLQPVVRLFQEDSSIKVMVHHVIDGIRSKGDIISSIRLYRVIQEEVPHELDTTLKLLRNINCLKISERLTISRYLQNIKLIPQLPDALDG